MRIVQDPLLDDPVDRSSRLGVTANERVGQNGLDRPFGGDSRLVFRITDRLGFAGAAEEPHAEDADRTTATRPLAMYRNTA